VEEDSIMLGEVQALVRKSTVKLNNLHHNNKNLMMMILMPMRKSMKFKMRLRVNYLH
jgi:hypothetical protein